MHECGFNLHYTFKRIDFLYCDFLYLETDKIPILVLAVKWSCDKFMSTVLLSQALSKMYRNLLCARIKLWCNLNVVNE